MPHTSETTARGSTRSGRASLPGAWPALLITMLSAVVFGVWAGVERAAPIPPSALGESRVAEVSPRDFEAALGTIDASAGEIARARKNACANRLASVTIMRAPGQPPGRIRLQSGGYLSPAFELTDMPTRVALPFPAPYAVGQGTIAVLGATTGAVVSLLPAWHVPPDAGLLVRRVTWRPREDCPVAPGRVP